MVIGAGDGNRTRVRSLGRRPDSVAHAQLSPSLKEQPGRRISHRNLGKIWERSQNLKARPNRTESTGRLFLYVLITRRSSVQISPPQPFLKPVSAQVYATSDGRIGASDL